jgi:hypothetical protein
MQMKQISQGMVNFILSILLKQQKNGLKTKPMVGGQSNGCNAVTS